MDSLTQGLLGAVTFAIVKDKEIGKKSLLIGAIAGTLPDLDVFLAPFFNDIEFLTVHRSVSHSILLAVILSVGLGALFHRWYQREQSQLKWIFAFFLAIMTHSLLDWCTTYGTKLLSPFNDHLFSTNNIHTFEPFYTLILLIGVIVLLIKKNAAVGRQSILNLTLLLSIGYLGCTFKSKDIASNQFIQSLAEQNIAYQDLIVSPTPLNCILWHGMAKTANGYYIGTYSLLDKRQSIVFEYVESEHKILSNLDDNRLIKYYVEYTQDFPLVKTDDHGNVEIYAIKYGPINYLGNAEFVYPLTFNLHDLSEEHIQIDRSGKERGPVKNYKNLLSRVKGI